MKNLIFVFILIVFFSNAMAQSWALTSTFPDTYYPDKRSSGVYVTVGTKAYVGLGKILNDNQFGFLQDFWEYDEVTKIWTKLANFPGQARYDAVAFAIGNNIYVGGGDIQLKAVEDPYGTYKKDFYVFKKHGRQFQIFQL